MPSQFGRAPPGRSASSEVIQSGAEPTIKAATPEATFFSASETALLRVRTHDELLVQPWAGASWEGFVIEQVLGTIAALGGRVDPYFLRTSDGHEIDLLLDLGKERWAIETKLTSSPHPEDLARLNKVADLVHAGKRILVSQTAESAVGDTQITCDLPTLLDVVRKRFRPSKRAGNTRT